MRTKKRYPGLQFCFRYIKMSNLKAYVLVILLAFLRESETGIKEHFKYKN